MGFRNPGMHDSPAPGLHPWPLLLQMELKFAEPGGRAAFLLFPGSQEALLVRPEQPLAPSRWPSLLTELMRVSRKPPKRWALPAESQPPWEMPHRMLSVPPSSKERLAVHTQKMDQR